MAATPAGFDMTTVLVDFDEKPLKNLDLYSMPQRADDPTGEKAPGLTIGHVCFAALIGLTGDQQAGLTAMQKFAITRLAGRVRKGTDVKISTSEVEKIKEAVGKFYNGLVVMRVIETLDPNGKVPEV